MEEMRYPTDDARLRDNIRTELLAQRGGAYLVLDDEQVDRLAAGIADNITYAFKVQWSPRWVKPGEAHRWAEPTTGKQAEHLVECLQCKRITKYASKADAEAWYEAHAIEGHANCRSASPNQAICTTRAAD